MYVLINAFLSRWWYVTYLSMKFKNKYCYVSLIDVGDWYWMLKTDIVKYCFALNVSTFLNWSVIMECWNTIQNFVSVHDWGEPQTANRTSWKSGQNSKIFKNCIKLAKTMSFYHYINWIKCHTFTSTVQYTSKQNHSTKVSQTNNKLSKETKVPTISGRPCLNNCVGRIPNRRFNSPNWLRQFLWISPIDLYTIQYKKRFVFMIKNFFFGSKVSIGWIIKLQLQTNGWLLTV